MAPADYSGEASVQRPRSTGIDRVNLPLWVVRPSRDHDAECAGAREVIR